MSNHISLQVSSDNTAIKIKVTLYIYMAIAKIRGDGKRPYSKSIFEYINSINKYENVTLNFTNDRILTLLDDEIITNRKRSGENSFYLTEKKIDGSYSNFPSHTHYQ